MHNGNRGKILRALLALILGLAGTSSFAGSKTLNITGVYQQQSRWCWAAAAQMIINYIRTDYKVTQSDVVFQALGYLQNTGGDVSVGDALAVFGIKEDLTGPIEYKDVKTQINANLPVQVDIQQKCTNCGRHSLVITGYREVGSYQYLIVWNPYSGFMSDPDTGDPYVYSKFKDNSSFSWRLTRSNIRLQ